MSEAKDKTPHFTVDGKTPTSFDDLTYREKQEALKVLRNLTGNPEEAWDDDVRFGVRGADMMYRTPVLLYIAKKRLDASYTLDQALDSKDADCFKVLEEKRPPTKRSTPAA